MSDEPTSGNRWENPADKPEPTASARPADEQPTTAIPADGDPVEPAAPGRSERLRTAMTSTRTRLGAVAAAIFLVGGGAGFALASATGEHHGEGDFRGPDRGFDHRFAPPGQLPNGRLPNGQLPNGQQGQNPFGQNGEGDDGANGSGT